MYVTFDVFLDLQELYLYRCCMWDVPTEKEPHGSEKAQKMVLRLCLKVPYTACSGGFFQ